MCAHHFTLHRAIYTVQCHFCHSTTVCTFTIYACKYHTLATVRSLIRIKICILPQSAGTDQLGYVADFDSTTRNMYYRFSNIVPRSKYLVRGVLLEYSLSTPRLHDDITSCLIISQHWRGPTDDATQVSPDGIPPPWCCIDCAPQPQGWDSLSRTD